MNINTRRPTRGAASRHADELSHVERYWVPAEQEWLSLSEIAYLRVRKDYAADAAQMAGAIEDLDSFQER